MRRQALDVKPCNGPARPRSSGAQATGPAEHAHVLTLARTRRRVPTLLARVRSRLGQEALAARRGEAGRRSVIVPGDRAGAQDRSGAPGDPRMAAGRHRAALHDRRPLVLVVDDEESYRQALMSGLGQEGFSVTKSSFVANDPETKL